MILLSNYAQTYLWLYNVLVLLFETLQFTALCKVMYPRMCLQDLISKDSHLYPYLDVL